MSINILPHHLSTSDIILPHLLILSYPDPWVVGQAIGPFLWIQYIFSPQTTSHFSRMDKCTIWSSTWKNFLSSVYFKAIFDCGYNEATIYFQLLYQVNMSINQVQTSCSASTDLKRALHMTLSALWGRKTSSTRVDNMGTWIFCMYNTRTLSDLSQLDPRCVISIL